jgi:sec-independent protein translocase protein TatC
LEINTNLISFLAELRKSIRLLGASIIIGTVGCYFLAPSILLILQKHLDQKLAFFTVAEPFLSLVKLAFFTTIFVMMPGILYCLWKALGKPFQLSPKMRNWFVFFTCLLFYGGAGFCYFITLPYGVQFLLGFQTPELKAVISIGKFVTFVSVFVLAFGAIFELPILMIFTARVGIWDRQSFERQRRYAILIISILAALLTPTPDIVNMMLMGVPLYLLYEMGIIILKILKL